MTTADSFSGTEARRLIRHMRHASLATRDRETGYPYASLVNFATDLTGRPAIFISRLARHTVNLLTDRQASLLVCRLPATGDALTGARVTVIGDFEPIERADIAERYGDHHPPARAYLDFPDFSFWGLRPRLAHAIAGFGRIQTFDPNDVFLSQGKLAGFADLAGSAARHLNEDHADAMRLCAVKLLGMSDDDWRVTSIDPDGALLETKQMSIRLEFDSPAISANELRQTFVDLARRARET